MKSVFASLLILAAGASRASADDVTKEDLLKLARAGVSDPVILSFLKSRPVRLELTADDVVELKAAGLSDEVLATALERSAVGRRPATRTPIPAPTREVPPVTYVPSTPYTYDPEYAIVSYSHSHYADPYAYSSYNPYNYYYVGGYSYGSHSYGHSYGHYYSGHSSWFGQHGATHGVSHGSSGGHSGASGGHHGHR
jgi:hypothetical protein